MGLLKTRWCAREGALEIEVMRDEVTRGIQVSAAGKIIGTKKWSWLGTGTIEGTVEHEGKPVRISARVFPPWKCRISADGHALSVTTD